MSHRSKPILAALVASLALQTPFARAASTYYFSPSGSDAFGTSSEATPWASLSKLNSLDLSPGDRVLLQGGATFNGNIYLEPRDTGVGATGALISPIQISTYGAGRATINAGTNFGIYGYNNAGFEISNLNLVGSGWNTSTASGVGFYTDLAGGVKMEHLRVSNLTVSGFKEGVSVGTWNGATGFRDVIIDGVVAHDNMNTGIITYAQSRAAHQNVAVRNSRAYNNYGNPNSTGNTGSGIVLGNVDGGVIEYSVAHDNGINNKPSEGPVGIWTYDSNNIAIQYNESYNNKTSGGDGGGFDLDQNVTNSVMQYNYSHGNDGAGYLLYDGDGTGVWNQNNVVRYNISQNDGRRGNYPASGIFVGGNVRNLQVYNNTIFTSNVAGEVPAIKVEGGTALRFYNNILQTTGGERLLSMTGATDVQFVRNAYWSSGAATNIRWAGTTYTSVAAWLAAATTQERIDGTIVALNVDPGLANPGAGGVIGDATQLHTLAAYRLLAASALRDAGLDLTKSPFSITVGGRDFYAVALPQGAAYDVGASEVVPEPSTATLALAPVLLMAMRRRRA